MMWVAGRADGHTGPVKLLDGSLRNRWWGSRRPAGSVGTFGYGVEGVIVAWHSWLVA
jgi:hypothetical protein